MKLLTMIDIHFACDITELRLDVLKRIRKEASNFEQNLNIQSKRLATNEEKRAIRDDIKEEQRKVKAATLLIDFFLGKGKFVDSVRYDDFPLDLHDYIRQFLAKAFTND